MSSKNLARKKSNNFKLFKVLKQKGVYICGVCRSAYLDERHALTCLKNCGSHDLDAHQVDKLELVGRKREPAIKKFAKEQSFRCKYCKRTYESKDEATACASACKPLFAGKHRDFLAFRDIHLSNEPLADALKLKGFQCGRCNSFYHSQDEAKACFNGHAIAALTEQRETMQVVSDPIVEDDALNAELVDLDFDFHDSDSFVEYPEKKVKLHQCPVCKEEYDSEEDQAQCYATHFD